MEHTAEAFGKDALHQREKEEFLKLLKQTGEDLPEGGRQVLDLFLDIEGHVSPDFLTEKLAEKGIRKDIVTQVLDTLCRYGMAQRIYLNGSGPWYEHLHLGADHDHLMCTKCGRVVEFKDPELKEKGRNVANSFDFQPLVCRVTILGLCPRCRKREGPIMPLSMAARGERVRVVRFLGGHKMQNKLTSMGITIGDVVEVINNTGPYIIHARGSRLALGKGLAHKVMVSLCQ